MSATPAHPSFETLLDYWLHDTDAAATDAVDEHLLRCDACGEVLDGIIALGEGVRAALRAGEVLAVAGGAFAARLLEQGRTVREYRLPHNGSIHCTVAPEDEWLVTRLQAPLQGVSRLDMLFEGSLAPGVAQRLQDIPFDARAGEVVYVSKLSAVKKMPAQTMQVTLLAVEDGGTREVGRYAFSHSPWPGA